MLFDYDALWQHQTADNEVPADPFDVEVPAAGWDGPDPAPYGTIDEFVTNLEVGTEWAPGDALWLRRALTVDGEAAVVLRGEVKNACFVYLDGDLVGVVNPTNAAVEHQPFQMVIPQALLDAGVHQLAVLCLDEDPAATDTWVWLSADYLPALLPLWPGTPLSETIEWMTGVIVYEGAGEEREALRGDPRHQFRIEAHVPSAIQPRVNNMLYGARALTWLVPSWPQVQHVGGVAAGELTLDVLTSFSEYEAGGLVLLWENADVWQVLGIEAVTDANSLALTTPTVAFGDAYAMPVRRGYMTSDPGRAFNGRDSRLAVSFEIEENRALEVAAPAQYLGNDVYWGVGLLDDERTNEAITTVMDVRDDELGLVSYSSPWPFNKPSRRHKMIGEDPEEAWAIRQWLHRRRGRLTPFWHPSFEVDLRVVSTGALTTTLRVMRDDYLRFAGARDHIAVETASGWLPRAILDAEAVGTTQMDLTLSSSLAIDAAAILRVCFLGLRRLNADRIEINWMGGTACAVTAPVLDIEP